MKIILKKAVSFIAAAAVAISSFSALSVYAEGEYEAKTVSTWKASAIINALGDGVEEKSGTGGQVRMTPIADTTDYGAKIGVFRLGKVEVGSQVTVTAKLYTANNDLNGVGLYTTAEEVSKVVDEDYKAVMQGNALAPLGTISAPSNSAKEIQGITLQQTTFTGEMPQAGSGKLLIDDSHLGTITYTAEITSDNAGYLYFIAGGWNGTNRLVQVVDVSVEYSSTLGKTITYASDSGTVNVLNDSNIGNSRLDIKKNLTIAAEAAKTITSNVNSSTYGILVKGGKSVAFNNVNITAETAKRAVVVEEANTKVTFHDAAVKGDVYQGSGAGTAIILNNTSVTGKVFTRMSSDAGASSTSCTITLTGTASAADVAFYKDIDTLKMDVDAKIGTLTVAGEFASNDVVVEAVEGETLSPDQITAVNEGYILAAGEGEQSGNLIIKTEPTKEVTPSIGIDYETEELTGFEDDAQYSINDTSVTVTNGKLSAAEYIGNDIAIVRIARGSDYANSNAQNLTVPSRPAAPSANDFTVTQPSEIGGKGSISGITSDMEYSTDGGQNWVAGDGNVIENIEGGTTYVVRKKAVAGTSFKSGNYSIGIETFGAQKETTPNITIDYENEKLTGFGEGSYTIGDSAVAPENGELAIADYIGKTISIVKKGNGSTTNDSDAQSLTVPTRPAAPSVSAVQPSVIGEKGSITGVSDTMEYKQSNAEEWTAVDGTEITNLEPGEYKVRVKATESSFKGNETTVTINAFDAQKETTPDIVIDYENEKLTGFGEGSYTIGGSAVAPENGELAIADYIGKTISIIKKGNGSTTNDSDAQSLIVPARPAAPSANDFTVTQPSEIGGKGSISGITSDMEYSTDGGQNWAAGDGNVIENIEGGTTYVVRKKAVAGTSFKSGNYSISIETFGAQKETTPDITIDYENEKLTGFGEGSYTIGGSAVAPENGELAIADYIGETISIVKKGNGSTTNDSDAQSLTVPARPDAPSGVSTVDETAADANDGKITGVNNTMEYKQSSAEEWTSVDSTEITNLEPGEYKVRVKATESGLKSNEITVTINKYTVSPLKSEIVIGDKIVNGTDSSTINISVTNPTSETESGVLIAALYSGNICRSVSIVKNGSAYFNTTIEDGMTVKAFLWNSLSGENAMIPILPCISKTI